MRSSKKAIHRCLLYSKPMACFKKSLCGVSVSYNFTIQKSNVVSVPYACNIWSQQREFAAFSRALMADSYYLGLSMTGECRSIASAL